ncbi:glutamine synthetase [Rhodospirillum rubrum]|uniref:glutamine synthetase family protein n=1 Tax=Rhodospirillum rubrum TaxID=1085 RepID=UPI0019059E9B|nr:glutamine synthetase family protein [Rhodospirillum rubrum]MBK1664628.1 glutamine synthetase [Rhodospirillum rubrum]MBK1676309.1 glutamine synthetase [Rhodospirillum rubrum]
MKTAEPQTIDDLERWIKSRGITEVECLVPDLSGIPRGKILPARKFLSCLRDRGLRLPESVFTQTVTGEYPEDDPVDIADSDVYLRPDPRTIRVVPWYQEPTAQVINDCFHRDRSEVHCAPRQVLRNILALYEKQGWKPVVAPELEFYLVRINADPDYPLEPPIGRSGRAETGRQAYGIDAVNEFDPLFEDIYDYAEEQNLDLDTLHHESGSAQMEINFLHGDPMELADQVFLFKRTVRQAALRHNVYATFMAKPLAGQPGSAMHLHQSITDAESGRNILVKKNGEDSDLFRWHIGGLQKYLPHCMLMLAPNVNSYRRFLPDQSAPINMHWGHDNRTVSLRVPYADASARRVENRLSGADANPYLAIAASLACGYLGMIEKIEPTAPITGSAYTRAHNLPRHLPDAIERFERARPLHELLNADFVRVYASVKWAEWDAYQHVISSWEREYLLLNV